MFEPVDSSVHGVRPSGRAPGLDDSTPWFLPRPPERRAGGDALRGRWPGAWLNVLTTANARTREWFGTVAAAITPLRSWSHGAGLGHP